MATHLRCFESGLLDEVTEWLGAVLEELDFQNEAKNQRLDKTALFHYPERDDTPSSRAPFSLPYVTSLPLEHCPKALLVDDSGGLMYHD